MSLINSTAIPSGATGYEIDQSLRFNDDGESRLVRTPTINGNRRTFTLSMWVKRGNHTLGTDQEQTIFGAYYASSGSRYSYIAFNDTDGIIIFGGEYSTSGTPQSFYRRTQAKYRDSSAWYHIVWRHDSTDGTAANRDRLYVNGVLQDWDTSLSTDLVCGQNEDSFMNYTTSPMTIGEYASTNTTSTMEFDGYMAEMHWIDGTSVAVDSFGETGDYGEWKPIEYSGSYGTNGFYLPFKQDYTVEGFSSTIYTGTGNGAVPRYIGGVGFQPDLIWWKQRYRASGSPDGHLLMDSVRGTGTGKWLSSDQTGAEGIYSSNANITSLDTDGFTIGATSGGNALNGTGYACVAWSWDMGGSNATNNDGNTTSVVRANTTYGQSIVTYTGTGSSTTIGHGLDSAPNMIMVKCRSESGGDWKVQHTGLSDGNKVLYLNSDTAEQNEADKFGAFAGATTFPLNGGHASVNGSSKTYVAYCFHSVSGYSSVGSYSGSGSSGKVITTGFKPAFVMLKHTNGQDDWYIFDNTRSPTNPVLAFLKPNSSNAEGNIANGINFTNTGFTILDTGSGRNASGGEYIYAAFADKREYAYWLDQSGNNNDWTSNNLTESDVMVDSPTNNFATLNPLHLPVTNPPTFAEGNLEVTTPVNGAGVCVSTMGATSGKWYAEFYIKSSTDAMRASAAVTSDANATIYANTNIGSLSGARDVGYMGNDGEKFVSGSESSYGDAFSIGDIIGIVLDVDNNTVNFYHNNVAKGNITMASTGTYHFAYGDVSAGVGSVMVANFGQDSSFAGNKTAQGNQDGNSIGDFYYAPPTGFLALCTSNLPDVAVVPSENFNTILYTGDDQTGKSITGVGFAPSFIWFKERQGTAHHVLHDAVRGASAGRLSSNRNNAEDASTSIASFDSDGFTVGSSAAYINSNNANIVAWNWKANGSGSSNTNGSITSTVSANVDAGFSIVSYTGTGANATVGHGLSSTPEMIITKNRDSAIDSVVYHSGTSANPQNEALSLSSTSSNSDYHWWNDTAPTSSVFSLGNANTNNSSAKFIAYCFHSVDGYSKVGSYTGNGNADGTFVYTGFRPAFVLTKQSSTTGDWTLHDSARDIDNPLFNELTANSSGAEGTSDADIDFTSNGFKIRRASGQFNTNGATVIYLAFAESPFKNSNAR